MPSRPCSDAKCSYVMGCWSQEYEPEEEELEEEPEVAQWLMLEQPVHAV